ncbi:contactin-2-like [Diadema antillarum]|uniref:contactin-2-like n=1 Tax=Diadema antillarum TaxID=105358 RepID=UPI003A861B9A
MADFHLLRYSALIAAILLLSSCTANVVFTETPQDTVVVMGQPAMFHCASYDDMNLGMVVTSWQQNGTTVQLGGRFSLFPNGTLYLSTTQGEDQGNYSCTASAIDSLGQVRDSRSTTPARLQFAYLEEVFYQPTNLTVIDRQETPAYFQCITGDSLPLASVSWEKDGQPLRDGEMDMSIYSSQFGDQNSLKVSGTLQINAVTVSHAGLYRCVVTNPLLPNHPTRSAPGLLTVNANPGAPYISTGPSSQTIPVGQPATFPCVILGDPAPTITWLIDGVPSDFSNSSNAAVLSSGSLYFLSVSLDDEASYVCTGTSRLGSVSTSSATLTVASMDWNFVTEPSDVEELQGRPVTLACSPPASRPPANVTWYKNHQVFAPHPSAAVVTSEGDLFILSVSKEDEGSYFCVASNEYIPREVTSRSATLTVAVRASITNPPNRTEVVLGSELSLDCQAAGDPPPTIVWYRDGRLLTANSRTTTGSNGLLHIRSVVAIDEGTYSCEASNSYGTDTASAFVNVLIPPQITSGPGEVTVAEGSQTTIPCAVIGDPAPNVTWFRDGAVLELDPSDPSFVLTNQGLFLTEAQLEHAGMYRCRSENRVGMAESEGTLTVWSVPAFVMRPQNKTVQENMVVTFSCNATGIPEPTLSWLFNGGALPSWGYVSDEGRMLSIAKALPEMIGKFACVAQNAQGIITAEAFLDVLVEPVVDPLQNMTLLANRPLSIPCSASGSPSPTFTWLKGQDVLSTGGRVTVTVDGLLTIDSLGNADEGWYSCVAHNDVGNARESFYLTVIDVPGQPVILTASPVSATSVYLVWTVGGDAGDTTHFQIQYKLSSSQTWLTYVDNLEVMPGNQTYTLHSLQENREYHIRVLAKNVIGQTPSTMEIVTTPAVTGPSAPRNFRVTSFNATAVGLSWEISVDRNGPIDTYLVEYTKLNTNDYRMQHIPGSGQATVNTAVGGLRPNTVYMLRVCAATLHNGERQWGNCTDYVEQKTQTAAPDGFPGNVSAVAVSSTSINVSWAPIPEYYRNGPILGYGISYREAGSSQDYSRKDVIADVTSDLLTGLLPWTTYEVRVHGLNTDGIGPPSDGVMARTIADAPTGAPQDVVLETINQTSIGITWQPVPLSSRRGPIDGFTVFYREAGTTSFLEMDVGPQESSAEINGLRVAQQYMIQILAYNLVDGMKLSGPRTTVQSVSTADGIPGPVTQLTAIQRQDSITLQWSPPLVTNGQIIGYGIKYTAMPLDEVVMTTEVTPTETVEPLSTDAPVTGSQNRRRRRREVTYRYQNETHGFLDTTETRHTLTGLLPEMRFGVWVAAKTSAGYSADIVSLYVFTGKAPPTTEPTTPMVTTATRSPNTTSDDSGNASFFNLFNLPKVSLILFLSVIGVGFLAIIVAIAVLSAWCSSRKTPRHIKRKATLLLPNDGQGSPGASTPIDEGIIGNQSRSGSNSVCRSHSPSNSSGMGTSTGLPSTPGTTPMMDSQPLIRSGVSSDELDGGGPLDPTRPRASSSPASAQLSVKAVPTLTLPTTGSVNLYPTAPNPRNGRPNVHSDILDTSPAGLEALYSRVNQSNLQGQSRLKKDSLAAIAVLLDQEENDPNMRPLDSPPSVVIANQRTTL